MPEVGDIVTVILWDGDLRRDADAMLGIIETYLIDYPNDERPKYMPARLRVESGEEDWDGSCRWFVVVDAVRYQP